MSYAWARYSTLPVATRWLYLESGNGHFVALNSTGTVAASSADGFTWTQGTMGIVATWGALGYVLDPGNANAPTFLAVDIIGRCEISTDNGLTWTDISGIGVPPGESPRGIAYGNGVIVIVTSFGNVYWSDDLSGTWNGPITIAVAALPNYGPIAFGNGLFIAATRSGTLEYATSTDGNTWSTGLTPPTNFTDFAVGNGLIMGVNSGTSGTVSTTVDGVTWSTPVSLPTPTGYQGLAFGANTWVAAPLNTQLSAVSTDNGTTWTDVAYPADGFGEFGRLVKFEDDTKFVSLIDVGASTTVDYLVLEVAPPDDGGGGDDGGDGESTGAGGIGGGPVNETWLYDGSTGFWSKLKSFGIDRHRVQFSFQLAGMTIGADYANGKLYRITDTALSDNGQSIEGEIVGETIAMPDDSFVTVNKLRVVMETGVGTTVGPGSNPQVSLSLSRDNGRTWGAEMWKPLGAIGEYQTRLEWRRLGTTRYFTAKLRITDAVKRVIVGAAINPQD